METVLAVDFDKYACSAYAANFPGVPVVCAKVSDVMDRLKTGMADVVMGGPPCPPFSKGGRRMGTRDPRNAIPCFAEAVRRINPRAFLMEQVDEFARFDGGGPALEFREEMAAAGYVVAWRILNAADFGVPQFRNRSWFWGIRADLYAAGLVHQWPEPTHQDPADIHPCLFGSTPRRPWVTVGDAIDVSGEYSPYRWPQDVLDSHRLAKADSPSPTVTAAYAKSYSQGLVEEPPKATAYRWSREMLTKHPPATADAPAPTIMAKWYKGGAEGLVSADGRTWDSRHPVASPCEPAPTLRARSPRDGGRCMESVVPVGLMVRRLTPEECMRLQSAPDDYAWPESVSKTQRYKIAGNGWASKMGHVFRTAFCAADPELSTSIDLFSGGGLGACGWHGRYWEHPEK